MPKNIQLHHQPRLSTQHGAPGFGRSSPRSGVALAVAAVSAAVLSLTSCGVAPTTQARTSDSTTTSPSGTAGEQSFQQALASLYSNNGSTVEMTGVALLVLENANKATGAQICLVVLQSLPPQCGGPKITNWSWEKVEGEESRNGVTWLDDVLLQGTFKNGEFTMTQEPKRFTRESTQGHADDVEPETALPCPTPEGGWTALDSAKSDARHLSLTVDAQYTDRREHLKVPDGVTLGAALPGFAGASSFYLNADKLKSPEDYDNDSLPRGLVMYVTGDISAATKEFRKTWGGPLCVAKAEKNLADQDRIHNKISDDFSKRPELKDLGYSSSGFGPTGVGMSLVYGAEFAKNYIAQKYGVTTSQIHAAFKPVAASNGSASPSTTAASNTGKQPGEKSFTAVVWEDTKGQQGPKLCTALKESFPPKCEGMPITNWSWDQTSAVNENQGIKWSDNLSLRGTVIGGKITLSAVSEIQSDTPVSHRPTH